jgi:hypothetical protein
MAQYEKVGTVHVYRQTSGGGSGCLLASIALLTGFSGFVASVLFMIF